MAVAARISIENLAAVFERLADLPGAVEVGIRDVATTLRSLVLGRSPVDTGVFKLSWGAVQEHEGGFSFTNPLPYAHVLEEGLYLGTGPRTTAQEGQVYSRQAPGGVAGPIVEDPETIELVARLIAQEIERRLRGDA